MSTDGGEWSVIVEPCQDGLFVGRLRGSWNPDQSWWILGQFWTQNSGEELKIWCGWLIPGYSEMVHGQSSSHFPDLLIGLLCGEKIVYGENHGSKVSQPFSLYSHGSPEACVQAGCDPCGTEIGSIVEIGQWLWRFKTTYFGEVARDVEPEQCNDKRLPGGQALRETGRESSKEWRAVLIAAMMCC